MYVEVVPELYVTGHETVACESNNILYSSRSKGKRASLENEWKKVEKMARINRWYYLHIQVLL